MRVAAAAAARGAADYAAFAVAEMFANIRGVIAETEEASSNTSPRRRRSSGRRSSGRGSLSMGGVVDIMTHLVLPARDETRQENDAANATRSSEDPQRRQSGSTNKFFFQIGSICELLL